MTTLRTEPNIAAPDDFYQQLIELHRDLTDGESALVNAKLVLLLANHIGDAAVLHAAFAAARQDVGASAAAARAARLSDRRPGEWVSARADAADGRPAPR